MGLYFNLKDYLEGKDLEGKLIPHGEYAAQLELELKFSNSGKEYILVKAIIVNGDHKNRVAKDMLFTDERYGYGAKKKTLEKQAQLCRALNIDVIEDINDLDKKYIGVNVDVESGDEKYPEKNVIVGYFPLEDYENKYGKVRQEDVPF